MMKETLETKLEFARLRERQARARTSRLRRSLDQSNRRLRNQTKYVLGAAMLALAESGRGEQLVFGFRKCLAQYVTREKDRAVLIGTAFSMEAGDSDNAPR